MTKPDRLDEILYKLVMDSQYDWYPENYTAEDKIAQAKQAINAYILDIIGEDDNIKDNFETAEDGGVDIDSDNGESLCYLCKFAEMTGRNQLRAEQRAKLTQEKERE